MKQLYLLRHAKSSWKEAGLPDHERGLNARGLRDAPRMGSALAQRLAPELVWVSSARRAQLTLTGLCAGWPALDKVGHRTDEELYTFSAQALLAWLRDVDDHQALFLIGHNPALNDLVNLLVGEEILYNLPTAGFAALEVDVEHWRDVCPGCATLDYTLFPGNLGSS